MVEFGPILALILRICGGTGGFMFAKAWGFYPASSVGAESKVFSHAYMQVVMIFLGEAFTGLFVLHAKENKGFEFKQLAYFILPSILDGAAYSFSNMGIGGELISVYQVFRLTTLVFTVLVNSIQAKDRAELKLDAYKLLAIALMVLGFVILAFASDGFTYNLQPDCGTTAMSCFWVVVSGLCSALHDYTARGYAKVKLHPLGISAMEGLVGMIIYTVAIVPHLAITGIELPIDWVHQHGTWYILSNQLLFLLSVFGVTCGGYLCSVKASPLAFQVVEAARPLLVMVASLCVQFEKLEIKFTLVSLCCQLLIIMGYVLYFKPAPKGTGFVEEKRPSGGLSLLDTKYYEAMQ